MEAPDQLDVIGSHGSSSSTGPYPSVLTKRKRTKRPTAKATATTTSSSPPLIAASSSTSSFDASTATTTDEEEDMANCLILLAQGLPSSPTRPPPPPPVAAPPPPPPEKFTSRKFTEAATTAGGKAGFYVYECKTCNKCFPSFQALGGHRASHKKPKMPIVLPSCDDIDTMSTAIIIVPPAAANSPTGNYNNNNHKTRVHECSICGAEFSSGQALGGHMRRHRPIGANSAIMQEAAAKNNNKEQRSSSTAALSLDLNLPAPSDDFSFADHKPMAALVDCHY